MQQLIKAIASLPAGKAIVVGRGPGADVRVPAKGVDPQHARILHRTDGLFVQDLNSQSGTFVNGREVRGLQPLQSGDRLRIGELEIALNGLSPVPQYPVAPAPPPVAAAASSAGLAVTLCSATKTVRVRDGASGGQRAILNGVSLHVPAGSFIGLLGASGSGKSTLIKVIAGLIDVSEGEVLLGGAAQSSRDRRHDRRIAYLPQDVVIHEALTPRKALNYIARLKGIGASGSERSRMIVAALERVGLGDRLDVPVRRLSGGQRKRAALAAELLGDPQVILLDEATSGLDPATEAEMMRLFRSLADEGRTVICITHFPDRLTLCDRLVYLMQGRVAFYGAPGELMRFFGASSIEEVYVRQSARSPEEWQSAFLATPPGQSVQQEALGQPRYVAPPMVETTRGWSAQAAVLSRRYLDLQLADWANLLLLVAQAPIIGLMIAATYGDIRASFAELHAARTKEVVFILVIAMLWCAGTAAVREIVKEQTILRHETRFGVRLLPYLLSKLALLCGIALLQGVALLGVVREFTGLTGQFPLQFAVLAMTAASGVALGLLVSAVAGTSERAMTVLPVLLIAQAVFSGGLARLEGWLRIFSQLFVPAYWSMDGLRATFGSSLTRATYPGAPGHYQAPILGLGGPLVLDLLALAVQGAVIVALTHAILRATVSGRRAG